MVVEIVVCLFFARSLCSEFLSDTLLRDALLSVRGLLFVRFGRAV